MNKLMVKYPKTRKEVNLIMGGKVIESEADRILQQGEQRGRQLGEQLGRQLGEQQMIEKMLRNHRTPEQIAEFSGCDLAEICAVQQKMLQKS